MSALRRAVVRIGLAFALASGLAGAASAQFKIETIGDWDRVTIEHLGFFVAAAPGTRAARGYCIADFLDGTGYVEALKADPEVMKAGRAPGYACVRLDCKPQGHGGDAEITITANAPPLAEAGRAPDAVSLRMRAAPGEAPVVLFEGARQRGRSRGGDLELLLWEAHWVRGSTAVVETRVTMSATNAFLDRLAARPTVEFELSPWAGTRGGGSKAHAGRTVSFSLARMADVLAALRQQCAERAKRRN